ncbi:MAG: aminotransferase class V-fold PLP-dependent enzyme, partial [Firmicutes bacterium]|nr:aminotransferase class V-fold PLP-dependent enzyme [Bacillota bacterium]
TVSAHKINGVKGAALLYKRKGLNLSPHIFGGGQESGVFSGTENLGAVLSFEFAANFHSKNFDLHLNHLKTLKDRLINGLKSLENVYVLEKDNAFSPHILNVSFKNVKAEVLQQQLSNERIYIGIGSACNKTSKEKRYLTPLNLEKGYFDGNIRLSLDFKNTKEELDEFLQKLKGALKIYG